jgi:hypothetical protein
MEERQKGHSNSVQQSEYSTKQGNGFSWKESCLGNGEVEGTNG